MIEIDLVARERVESTSVLIICSHYVARTTTFLLHMNILVSFHNIVYRWRRKPPTSEIPRVQFTRPFPADMTPFSLPHFFTAGKTRKLIKDVERRLRVEWHERCEMQQGGIIRYFDTPRVFLLHGSLVLTAEGLPSVS